jgi:hypothetical protein
MSVSYINSEQVIDISMVPEIYLPALEYIYFSGNYISSLPKLMGEWNLSHGLIRTQTRWQMTVTQQQGLPCSKCGWR